jgi:hypothetical protein
MINSKQRRSSGHVVDQNHLGNAVRESAAQRSVTVGTEAEASVSLMEVPSLPLHGNRKTTSAFDI